MKMRIKKKPEYKDMLPRDLGILIVGGVCLIILVPLFIIRNEVDEGIFIILLIFLHRFFKFFKIEL